MRIYISNLPYTVTAKELLAVFAEFSPADPTIVKDKLTGRPRGYAFLDVQSMPTGRYTMSGRRIHIGKASARK